MKKQSHDTKSASDVPWPWPVIKTTYLEKVNKEACYVRHRDNEGVYRA